MRRQLLKKFALVIVTVLFFEFVPALTAFAAVRVDPKRPTNIALSSTAIALDKGKTSRVTASVAPSTAVKTLRWSSSNRSVATVNATGLITARNAGTATITARSSYASAVRSTVRVTVTDPKRPNSIAVSSSSVSLFIGDKQQITAQAIPSTSSQHIQWASNNASVASVSSKGLITAKKAGTATIRARSGYANSVAAFINVTVSRIPAPSSLAITAPNTIVNKGGSMALQAAPAPANTDKNVTCRSSNTSVATVSASGVVSGKASGTVTVTATSKANANVSATVMLTVFDSRQPTDITFNVPSPQKLDIGQTLSLSATVLPSTAAQTVRWSSGNTAVATVSTNGLVTARRDGTAVITATHSAYTGFKRAITIHVEASPAPTALRLSAPSYELSIKTKTTLTVTTTPENASKSFTFVSSNTRVATVDGNGVVTAAGVGKAQITVVSKRDAAVRATADLTVFDPAIPSSITLNHTAVQLGEGDTITLTPTVLPSTAPSDVTWRSSNTAVATVTASGAIKAVNVGQAVITCTTRTGNISTTATVTVLQTTLTTALPAITTDVAGIPANLARIEALRRSAINEILRLQAQSVITAAESTARQAIINRAFEMYAFPWMTEVLVRYYSSANSHKNFQPNTVYYGLPYIQHGSNQQYNNRQYDKERALSGRYFTSSGKGYFLMSQTVKLNNFYVGNDCSSYVSMSQFGTGTVASFLNTTAITISSRYKTITNWNELRPGDLLVKSGVHTVLVLYYTNAAQTQLMLIHQGGAHNTIHPIFNTSYTRANGYIARRQIDFR